MGLPIHGSQNMNHIRLIYNKFIYVKSRYEYLLSLSRQQSILRHNKHFHNHRKKQKASYKNKQSFLRAYKASLSLPLKSSTLSQPPPKFSSHSLMHKQKLRQAFPIVSNMPFIHLNSSLILINTSPFALTDRRFGILHHHSPSMSYY